MDKVSYEDLLGLCERLLRDVESHSWDYHHVTPDCLIKEARELIEKAKKAAADSPE